MEKPEGLFIARLGNETMFVFDENLEQAQVKLSEVLDELQIERDDVQIAWFQPISMSKRPLDKVFVAQESHLGILEQTGEAEPFLVTITNNCTLVVLARSREEVLEHLAAWMTKNSVKPPLQYKLSELEEEAPWVFRLKVPTESTSQA